MISRFIFISLILFICLSSQAKSSTTTKTVSVEIELEEVPFSIKYEIEVKKITAKRETILNFSQKESYFKLKLNVGNYLVRTRIVSEDLEIGPWSEWSELLARPEEVNLTDVPTYNISVNKNQKMTEVDLKWEKANGADKYIVLIENVQTKLVTRKEFSQNNAKIGLERGGYKIGIQSVSKNGIRSEIKYFDNQFYVAHAQLPQIKLERINKNSFKWKNEKEAEVKIDIYRKAFFADKYTVIQTLKEAGDNWVFPNELEPGEYKIEFQYVSESFVNGPIQEVLLLKKPTEQDFKKTLKK